MTALLQAGEIAVRYGESEAVRGVSLAIEPGQIVTVLGPNGAGKTSLLKALMGALPCQGEIVFDGVALGPLSLEERAELGLALVPEERALFGEMSVEDNLALGAFRHRRDDAGRRRAARDELYALFPRLRERSGQLASTLSGGERQMLAMARTLIPEPDALLLDEPSAGLGPLLVDAIFEKIAEINAQGITVLMVEQNARRALAMSYRGYVLDVGRNRFEGRGRDLLHSPKVVDLYLGGTGRIDAADEST